MRSRRSSGDHGEDGGVFVAAGVRFAVGDDAGLDGKSLEALNGRGTGYTLGLVFGRSRICATPENLGEVVRRGIRTLAVN
jgi:hypothetical protein